MSDLLTEKPKNECPECKGTKTVVAYLGETKPCEKCGGTGIIEVIEEPLSPWQQGIEARLTKLEDAEFMRTPMIARPHINPAEPLIPYSFPDRCEWTPEKQEKP